MVQFIERERFSFEFINEDFKDILKINHLTQRTFMRVVNTVKDLVGSGDSANIEVIYKDEVIFNGYIDRDDDGNDGPHFWYNRRVLNAIGIKY